MKGILRAKSLLFLLPLMVFFCQKTNDPWGFCVGNNEGFVNDFVGTGAGNNFAQIGRASCRERVFALV